MNFSEWAPVYESILADFGFDRAADERARDLLGRLTRPFDIERLVVRDETVAIVGGAPSLAGELRPARVADHVFAASTAVDVLLEHDIGVDCMVTDLDKNPRTVRALTRRAIPVVIHAHGDNIPALRSHVPRTRGRHVLPTTQAAPRASVKNFGGFTDGDRAAFLADHVGASRLVFAGWDFDDRGIEPEKRRKLRWAERLLFWLERRRDERFGVLDGRRGHIRPLPTE